MTASLCHFAVSPKSQSFTSLPSKSTFSGLISRWWRSLVGTSLLHTANVDLDTVHEGFPGHVAALPRRLSLEELQDRAVAHARLLVSQ